jgi:hypothetical protein
MIVKKQKVKGIMVYYVDKCISDENMLSLKNTYVTKNQIKIIIDHDADVYSANDDKLLIKFRKKVLTQPNINLFYDNIIKFAMTPTSNRGSTSGSKNKNVLNNPKIMSNIFGFFDKFSPIQKYIMNKKKMRNLLPVRETRFNQEYYEQYKKTLPLIKEIDHLYEKNIPENYKKQKQKANQTPFKIVGTSFTTITTNVNFTTTIHKDTGDDIEGFGNLSVIENGKYTGGETCLPQYGIGVDVRNNDILFMDVHEWHGNLPIKLINPDAIRLSIVCYLRYNIWEKTKHKTKKFMIKHNKTVRKIKTT